MAAALKAFQIIEEEPELRQKLWDNTNYVHDKLIELGFNLGETQSCIFPVIIGDNKKVLALTQQLQNNGYLVNPVIYPAVPVERARIRFAVSSDNTKQQLDNFIQKLYTLSKEIEII
jgi:glycine C-acetyltransferase